MSDSPKPSDVLEYWALKNFGHRRVKTQKPAQVKKSKSTSFSTGGGKSGGVRKTPPTDTSYDRADFVRMVNESPEVVVKISKCSNDKKSIRGYMEYITKDGEIELENQSGLLYEKGDIREIVDGWSDGRDSAIPTANGKKRESLNIILSMGNGADPEKLKQAASTFAAKSFPDHEYVFAAHNDTNNPHVHLVVSMGNHQGVRLNPRKADLGEWRRSFASELRDNGIDANATPRRARGVVQKSKHQAVMNIDQAAYKIIREEGHPGRGYSRNTMKNIKDATLEAQGSVGKRTEIDPDAAKAKAAIVQNRKNINVEYKIIHKVLSESVVPEDKELANQLAVFYNKMPEVKTRHEQLVDMVVNQQNQKNEQEIGRGEPRRDQPKQSGPKI